MSDSATYGELYLLFVHRQGYPSEDERKAFNSVFYAQVPKKPSEKSTIRSTAVSSVHKALKARRMPPWVKSKPSLHRVFADVLADYKKKYESTGVTLRSALEDDDIVILDENLTTPAFFTQMCNQMKKEPIEDDEDIIILDEKLGSRPSSFPRIKQEGGDVKPPLALLREERKSAVELLEEWRRTCRVQQKEQESRVRLIQQQLVDEQMYLKDLKLLEHQRASQLKDDLIMEKNLVIQELSSRRE